MQSVEPIKPEFFEEDDVKLAFDWTGFSESIEAALGKLSRQQLSPTKITANPSSHWDETVLFRNIKFTLTRYWTSGSFSECVTGKNYETDTVNSIKAEKGESTDSDNQGYRSLNEQNEMAKAWSDMMDDSNMFPSHSHHSIHDYYGLKDFIVMSKDKTMLDANCNQMLLGSLSRAARKIKWEIPLFVHCEDFMDYEVWEEVPPNFKGSLECSGFKTSFDMDLASQDEIHVNDLYDDFIWKLKCINVDEVGAKVSARFTYATCDKSYLCRPETDYLDCDHKGYAINRFYLCTTWSEVLLTSKISDLDPIVAHKWSVKAKVIEPRDGILGVCLKSFLSLCSSMQTESLLLNPQVSSMLKYRRIYKEVNESLAMQGSAESKFRKVTSKLILEPEESLIPVKSLDAILDFLFCDGKLQQPQHLNGENPSTTTTRKIKKDDDEFFLLYKELSKYFESVLSTSLTGRLAICMCIINKCRGLGAVKQLWGEFVLEMKYRWEHNCEINGLEPVESNVDYAELLQKLQLLNSCIKKKKVKDASSAITDNSTTVEYKAGISTEEFVDFSKLPLSESQSEVRVDASTVGLRIEMLIDRLLSYKKAFISANPGYVLGDFVRWCSTEDHVEERNMGEGVKSINEAHPSQWIKISEDVSLVLHKSDQRRSMIPDDDAAKVLDWLALMKPSDLVLGLMPLLIHSAVATVSKDPAACQHTLIENHLKEAKLKLGQACPQPCGSDPCRNTNLISEKLKIIEDILQHLKFIEQNMKVFHCLLKIFRDVDPSSTHGNIDSEIQKFVGDLMIKGEASIPTPHKELPSKTKLGRIIFKIFLCHSVLDDLSRLEKQEYIFTVNGSGATASSKCVPQRCYRISGRGLGQCSMLAHALTSKIL